MSSREETLARLHAELQTYSRHLRWMVGHNANLTGLSRAELEDVQKIKELHQQIIAMQDDDWFVGEFVKDLENF